MLKLYGSAESGLRLEREARSAPFREGVNGDGTIAGLAMDGELRTATQGQASLNARAIVGMPY